jgi:hypothetical protein
MSERIVQLKRNILFLNYVRNDRYKVLLIECQSSSVMFELSRDNLANSASVSIRCCKSSSNNNTIPLAVFCDKRLICPDPGILLTQL